MECAKCGYIYSTLEQECPVCHSVGRAPGSTTKPGNAIQKAVARSFCPRCNRLIEPGHSTCQYCADQGDLRRVSEQKERQWRASDIAMMASIVLVLVFHIVSLDFTSVVGGIVFLATIAAYGLAALDVWQDENSFGLYAYAVTGWSFFVSLFEIIINRTGSTGILEFSHSGPIVAALDLVIFFGLWKRYAWPFD